MIDEYIEAMSEWMSEEQRRRSRRLADERYEALRKTIAHLYGQAFLDELEANVDERVKRIRIFDGIDIRLGILRKQYRTRCKIHIPYNTIGKATYRSVYELFNNVRQHLREQRDLKLMRKRSKALQRYNMLAEVILRDLGEEVQKELIWKAEVRAIAEIMDKCKYGKSSWVRGYCSNDRSFALRHLRILYAYERERHQDMYGTRIHIQINANYRNGMFDYKQANNL